MLCTLCTEFVDRCKGYPDKSKVEVQQYVVDDERFIFFALLELL